MSSTTSPLADPQTPIHRLAARIQNYLFFPDPSPLYAVAGCTIANVMCGYPTWLMLIGPASCGKTQLLKSLLAIDGIVECGDLSGIAALLSGVKKKDMAADAKGGLLRELPRSPDGSSRGQLIMLDFARTILAGDPSKTKATMGALGMLYDGHYEREVGTEGGKKLCWNGRIGFIGATTDAIDSAANVNAEMGERCMYYRYPDTDGYHETMAALRNPDPDATSQGIKQAFLDWAEETSIDWHEDTAPRQLTDPEAVRINALANFCARGRSGVDRDWRGREVVGIRRSELGPRFAVGLGQLLRGMERTGVLERERWKVLRQIAMDSLPVVRSEAIKAIQQGLKGTSEIADKIKLSASATARTLEDLEMHKLISNTGVARWELSELAAAQLKTGWAD